MNSFICGTETLFLQNSHVDTSPQFSRSFLLIFLVGEWKISRGERGPRVFAGKISREVCKRGLQSTCQKRQCICTVKLERESREKRNFVLWHSLTMRRVASGVN